MERSDSISSVNSTASKSSTSSTGAFAYQTRLLERATSGRIPGSPTRTNSGTSRTFFPNPTSPGAPSTTRKWTPSHRVGASVDATRSKWEERVRDAAAEAAVPSSPTKLSESLRRTDTEPDVQNYTEYRPATPPTNIRRHTVIVPSAASPTPSNNKINDVFIDRTGSPSNGSHSTYLRKAETAPSFPSSISHTTNPTNHRLNRTGSVDSWKPSTSVPVSPTKATPTKDLTDPETPTKTPTRRRPISLHSPFLDRETSPTKTERSAYGSSSPSFSPEKVSSNFSSPRSNASSPNPMAPTTYRSSYTSKKGNIAEQLGSKRRLGNHLPRIASGDSEPPEQLRKDEESDREETRVGRQPLKDRQLRSNLLESRSPEKPKRPDYLDGKVPDGDDVVGLPGRIQLKAPTPAGPDAPRTSYRHGLWADRQRHLIQAYEYLCHVGEAQQWIEGCLDEELGFGVVEMDDGLRNGVVLAKLVRAFEPNSVRRIYDAPKLDFRHSDNINIFFNFVRNVGLPEDFIFELTDLYNKKNIPKVIYCIHAFSHLMARRGLAQRIGNLVGRLEFTDDQLQKTQKGLKDSGVAMPNFGNVRNELAKEINEPPEEEEETEEERQRRELSECEASIVAFQDVARGFLVRKQQAVFQGRLRLAERGVQKLQARLRGALLRRQIRSQRENIMGMSRWATKLQAHARGVLVRSRWRVRIGLIRASAGDIIKLQAQARGYLQRRRYLFLKAALKRSKMAVVKLQSIARAKVARHRHEQLSKSFSKRDITSAIIKFQALARGILFRRRYAALMRYFQQRHRRYAGLQAHCRGMLLRRRMRTQLARLEDASNVVIKIQAAVRTYLARKRLLSLIRGLRKATPMIVALQTRARAQLSSQKHEHLRKALSQFAVKKSVGTFQQLARAKLAQNKHHELKRSLEVVSPDVKGLQATCRGFLVRLEWYAWRDHLRQSEDIATYLQALLRGTMVRKAHRQKMEYYRQNLNKVVKIQSLFRAKETREQYRQLTLGTNVTVGTIKNFVHLLDDSEADFQEEIKVERLRKRVVESIRENQTLENEVNDLDVKIALVVQNAKSFEEIVKTRRHHGSALSTDSSILAVHGDPFSPHALEQGARRKLELYQQLFYLLQTKGEYLNRLFVRFMSQETPEKNRRFLERVVLALYGYGQDRREDYLLLKLFQLAISDEITSADSAADIIRGHPLYINIAVHYMRPKQSTFVRDAFQSIIKEVINSEDLDLEADPSVIHKARIELEEMRTGAPSRQPKDVNFHEAIHDTETRAVYIRHLQLLQWWVQAFVTAICQSTRKMPYSMRYLARETLMNLKDQFPDEPPEVHATCLSRLVYYRFINPAIIAPETFDIVSDTVDIVSRKNLAQISKVLTQITSGQTFTDDEPAYLPINDYITKAIGELTAWLLEVADVPDAETQFRASEFLDVTVQPKPIYISPNEIYTMHGLLSQHLNAIAPDSDDTLRVIITELDGVPHAGSEELTKARDAVITLELTNRFAHVKDPHAEEKTLWVQAKRGVLAILRVQPAQGLLESLMRPVTSQDEQLWEDILQTEMEMEARKMNRRQPSAFAADAAYRLEDIRSLKFAAVKALAISNLLELEAQGKISRDDGFQGILNAIAGDVRSKHRKRLQRQQEMQRMHEALQELAERKKFFQEQIDSYHSYVETSMATMQRGKGKKRFVIPFTKQYFHLRDLQKSGKNPQFGSYVYSAKYLYEKGILLSIDQHSPRQFDKINLTMSSNTAGVFNLVLESELMGFTKPMGTEDIRMGDLLQAKYEQKSSLALFGGKVNVNLELFLFQINKKFYAS